MAFWNKNKDIVDLTLLQRKGILKKAEEIEKENTEGEENSDKTIDLSSITQNTEDSSPDVALPESVNPMAGFFGSMYNPVEEIKKEGYFNSNVEKENEHLRVKIEDLEYKIERLIERIDRLENSRQ